MRAPRVFALLAIAACAAMLAAGCGDSDDAADPGSAALGSPELQTSARESDCEDWNRASADDQLVIINSITEYESGEKTGTAGRFLPAEQTHELFDRTCEREYAGAFKLYKVYVRAAAFTKPQ